MNRHEMKSGSPGRVLISISSFHREFLAMRLLQIELERVGFEVMLTSRFELGSAFNWFKPSIVIVHAAHKIPELDHISKSAIIVLLQAESCTGSERGILSLADPNLFGARFDLIDIRYCWGELDYRLLKNHPSFKHAHLEVTGHPLTDSWYSSMGTRRRQKVPCLGISMSLRSLTHISTQNTNIVTLIQQIELNGNSGFFDPPNHAEDWIAFEAAWLRILGEIARVAGDVRISIRPHPTEDPRLYSYFKKFPNVEIDRSLHISDWFKKIDVLASFLSTSQIDAFVRGIPVVSIKNMFPKKIIESLPALLRLDHDKMIDGPDTAEALMRLVRSGTPPEQPNLSGFVADVFSFPSPLRPGERIAASLADIVRSQKFKKKAFSPYRGGTITGRFSSFLPLHHLLMLLRDLRGLVTGTENVGMSYCAHRIFRTIKANRLVSTVSRGFK